MAAISAFLAFSRLGAAEVVARFAYGANKMVYDTARDRLYVTSPANNSLAVIDAKTVTQIAMFFVGSNPQGMSISPDGNYLYIANSGATLDGIVAVNLNTLTLDSTKAINTVTAVTAVAWANNGVIYALTSGSLDQYNAATLQRVGSFTNPWFIYGGDLAVSPDRNTLYYGQFSLSPSTLYQINISGATPSVITSTQGGYNGESIVVSHSGQYIVYPNGAPYYITLYSTAYFPSYYGSFVTGSYPYQAAFSWDDSVLFTLSSSQTGYLGLFNTTTFVAGSHLPLPSNEPTGGLNTMLADPSDTLLFLGGQSEILVIGNPMVPLAVSLTTYSIDPDNNIFHGSFSSMRGRNYYLQYSVDLKNWTNLGNSIRGNGGQMPIDQTFPSGLGKVFFRVIKPNMN